MSQALRLGGRGVVPESPPAGPAFGKCPIKGLLCHAYLPAHFGSKNEDGLPWSRGRLCCDKQPGERGTGRGPGLWAAGQVVRRTAAGEPRGGRGRAHCSSASRCRSFPSSSPTVTVRLGLSLPHIIDVCRGPSLPCTFRQNERGTAIRGSPSTGKGLFLFKDFRL